MLTFFLPLLASAVLTLLVLKSAGVHSHLSTDGDLSGPQKFHARPVPRIGGVGMYAALWLMVAWAHFRGEAGIARFGTGILLCGVPAFAFGLIEDLTKRVSPPVRLLATSVSAALGVAFLSAAITRTDIPGLDLLVSTGLGALLATIFAVAGVANAVNIVDGFNGLSTMCVSLMLMAIGYVAYEVHDRELLFWSVAGVGAILGFFVWNFPAGLIFLGDGGAYFLGFFLAELGIVLISRYEQVSPLFPLMVCIYPVFETVFSIYRRKFIRSVPPGLPDGIHLHSLIYRRVMRWASGQTDARHLTRRNSMTAPYLWALCTLSLIPALLFWDSSRMLAACIVLFGFVYVVIYWRIVRFRTPRWLAPHRRRRLFGGRSRRRLTARPTK
ncbi:glycosyl transferase [Mitsuaria sp. WAJ17]|uniref:MraY family glycosyltransferase n=1 Tax=Mitsuaria sp. WAJ17 TaxID=2761452 RepID=UPI0016014096|nr:glycosyltransferase [Mitsuaria sp. WAJ17]MBB2484244.1 glycosyl transferase [Mitsuaria sp. WAJ17]